MAVITKDIKRFKQTPITSEYALVDSLVTYLRSLHYKVCCEVGNMGQSVDVVACRGGRRLLIEAKLYDWKRALQQCKAHVLVGDFVAIAMPKRKTQSPLFKAELNKNGWGLITYDLNTDSWTWAIYPRLNVHFIWKPQQEHFDRHLFNLLQLGEGK